MQPDVITFSILIKANCDVGRPLCFSKLYQLSIGKECYLLNFTFLSFNITAGEATLPGLKKH